jgi:hypothetical protein
MNKINNQSINLGLRGMREQDNGEKYIIKSLIICTHPILFG